MKKLILPVALISLIFSGFVSAADEPYTVKGKIHNFSDGEISFQTSSSCRFEVVSPIEGNNANDGKHQQGEAGYSFQIVKGGKCSLTYQDVDRKTCTWNFEGTEYNGKLTATATVSTTSTSKCGADGAAFLSFG